MSDYVADLNSPIAWVREAAENLGERFSKDAVVTDGVPRWKSNNQVPPADVCALWAHLGKPFDPATSTAAREADNAAFAAEYRRTWRPPSGEHLAEMRANGMVGEMVDVIAGRRYFIPERGPARVLP